MIIFHHDDMDGCSAAAIAGSKVIILNEFAIKDGKLSLSDEDKKLLHEYETRSMFVQCDYASNPIDPSLVEDGEDVIIVDLSFSPKTVSLLIDICKKANKVTWIDHHITSVRLLESNPSIREIPNLTIDIQQGISGAAITWKHYFTQKLPQFVEYVSDYDCWSLVLGENTTFFKIGIDMRVNGPTDKVWRDLLIDSFIDQGIDIPHLSDLEPSKSFAIFSIINDGKIAKSYIDYQNKSYLEKFGFETDVFATTDRDLSCLCVNWKNNSWVFGDRINDYDIVCVFAFNGKLWTYSLYSTHEEIDCAKIASQYDGGGHKGAAGFTTTHCLFDINPFVI